MQRLPSTGRAGRPKAPTSKSFTRFEPQNASPTSRARSNTLPESPVLEPTVPSISIPSIVPSNRHDNDIFETQEDDRGSYGADDTVPGPVTGASAELPIEIQNLAESFLDSLGAKVHPTPLSIDRLSQLFQDFYEHASEHINGHIAVLAARFPSEQSPTPSISSSGSAPPAAGAKKGKKPPGRPGSKTQSVTTEHQMLTPSEVAGRRKARRQLELKRIAMEEAVEQSICERVYPRIWRHRSTDDEERDEKLRSRAAALALVGVDLRELLSTALGSDVGSASQLRMNEEDGDSARTRLAGARLSLQRMNEERFPLGKLNHLKAAHKSIVETLQQIFPSTSSADEVLPTLIFTLITSDPDTNHAVSNFNFIQRFRASTRIDGEAAYCLTNLEAAITFLETVDLSSLRSDETPEGPAKSISQPPTPRTDTPDPMYHGLPSDPSSPLSPGASNDHATPPSSSGRPRGLSVLTQTRQRPFEAQSDAVLKKADEAFDTIHSALDGSFKFLFGRLRERQVSTPPHGEAQIASPKTLEDARKLISSPACLEDDVSIDGSSTAEQSEEPAANSPHPDKGEDNSSRMLQMIGGRRSRERSVDSGRSAESASRKVSFPDGSSPVATNVPKPLPAAAKPTMPKPKADDATQATTPTAAISSPATSSFPPHTPSAYGAVESMRSLGTTLNPLRGLAGMGMMRGFGRSASGPASTPPAATASLPSPLEQAGGAVKEREQTQQPHQSKAKDTISLSGVAPPVQRFVGCKEARELNGFEVELLLRDYQRLAGVLRALRQSERED